VPLLDLVAKGLPAHIRSHAALSQSFDSLSWARSVLPFWFPPNNSLRE
jgi:hypothetical protein